jgi:putative membrane protein insertion efficiency factor
MSPAWRRACKVALPAAFLVLAAGALAGQRLAFAGIHGYQRAIAPLAARAGIVCRFSPSCSRYAERVIARDGLLEGGLEAAYRIARCGPWTAAGTVEEP